MILIIKKPLMIAFIMNDIIQMNDICLNEGIDRTYF